MKEKRYQIRNTDKGYVIVDTWKGEAVVGWPERNHDRAFDRACRLNAHPQESRYV